jgi:hypothetical protein
MLNHAMMDDGHTWLRKYQTAAPWTAMFSNIREVLYGGFWGALIGGLFATGFEKYVAPHITLSPQDKVKLYAATAGIGAGIGILQGGWFNMRRATQWSKNLKKFSDEEISSEVAYVGATANTSGERYLFTKSFADVSSLYAKRYLFCFSPSDKDLVPCVQELDRVLEGSIYKKDVAFLGFSTTQETTQLTGNVILPRVILGLNKDVGRRKASLLLRYLLEYNFSVSTLNTYPSFTDKKSDLIAIRYGSMDVYSGQRPVQPIMSSVWRRLFGMVDSTEPFGDAYESEDMSISTHVDQILLNEFKQLVDRSNAFARNIIAFPTQDNRIKAIAKNNDFIKMKIVSQAQQTSVIMHKKVRTLIADFLDYKRQHGSDIERPFYEGMGVNEWIAVRAIKKRPLVFMYFYDLYLLRDGKTQGSGFAEDNKGFYSIGKDGSTEIDFLDGRELIKKKLKEKPPLTLEDYLSYDEMQISALIGVAGPTYFINDGNRYNEGEAGKIGTYINNGVYVGLVGARFERSDRMESQLMYVTKEWYTKDHGYGKGTEEKHKGILKIWEKFYGTTFLTHDEVETIVTSEGTDVYVPHPWKSSGQHTDYFNKKVYKERMRMVIEPFLLYTNLCGKETAKKVYVHIVGLGLGVWAIPGINQHSYMLDVYSEVIEKHNLSHISDLNFSHFFDPKALSNAACGSTKNGEIFKNERNAIKIHFSNRDPAAPLVGDDTEKLLVAMYAWDGNAFPGNEYWRGLLSASGDPAAACCSTIPELQNPAINTEFVNNQTFFPSESEE